MEPLSYYIGICIFIAFVVLGVNFKNDSTTCVQKNGKCSKLDDCCTRHGECCSHFCYKSFVWFNGVCMDPTVVQKLITSRNKANCDKKFGSSCTSDTDCKSGICLKEHAWNNLGVCKSSYDEEFDDDDDDQDDNDNVESGLCSYYNPVGKITASGEPYNKHAYTAAHRTLPFNTLVHVKIGELSFDVRINDRGPFDRDETMLNLAYDVADRMHIIQQGMVPCTIRAVGTSDAEVDFRMNNKNKNKNGNAHKNKNNSNKHKNNGDNCKQLWSNTCSNNKECCSNYCEKKDPKKATGVCKKKTR